VAVLSTCRGSRGWRGLPCGPSRCASLRRRRDRRRRCWPLPGLERGARVAGSPRIIQAAAAARWFRRPPLPAPATARWPRRRTEGTGPSRQIPRYLFLT
jgi:hypothetical protein